MKTKPIFRALSVLLLVGSLWFGRTAWRAHRQLVTLDVRNAPLAEVLRKVERQTWKKIRAEKKLDARITLRVTDKPLAYVMDQLAEQSGAHWSTLYAVYASGRALNKLDMVLSGDGKLEPAGWIKAAPKAPPFDLPEPGPGASVFHHEANSAGPAPGTGPMLLIRKGDTVMQQGPGGRVEMWSPEELVVDLTLQPRLSGMRLETASPAEASEAAQTAKAHWTTFLALRKAMLGMAGPPALRPGFDPLKRGPNDRFVRLTPAQRVARERERLNFDPK